MGSSSKRVNNKKKQHGGAHRTKRSDSANLRKAQALQHVGFFLINRLWMIVNPLLKIVEIMLFPKIFLFNAEIDPVDIVPGTLAAWKFGNACGCE